MARTVMMMRFSALATILLAGGATALPGFRGLGRRLSGRRSTAESLEAVPEEQTVPAAPAPPAMLPAQQVAANFHGWGDNTRAEAGPRLAELREFVWGLAQQGAQNVQRMDEADRQTAEDERVAATRINWGIRGLRSRSSFRRDEPELREHLTQRLAREEAAWQTANEAAAAERAQQVEAAREASAEEAREVQRAHGSAAASFFLEWPLYQMSIPRGMEAIGLVQNSQMVYVYTFMVAMFMAYAPVIFGHGGQASALQRTLNKYEKIGAMVFFAIMMMQSLAEKYFPNTM